MIKKNKHQTRPAANKPQDDPSATSMAEITPNSIVIGEIALNELIIAIEKAYFNERDGYDHVRACDELARGIKAIINHTDAEVIIQGCDWIESFRDCEDVSDMTELLGIVGGELRVEFRTETEVLND